MRDLAEQTILRAPARAARRAGPLRRQRLLLLAVVLAALSVLAGQFALPALAAEPVRIAGTWNVVTEQSGTGTKSEYQDTYEETKGGVVTGHGTHGSQSWPIKGGVFEESKLKISTGPEGGPYELSITATIAADTNSYEGTFKDTEGHEGTVKASRVGATAKEGEGGTTTPSPPPPPVVDPASVTVACGYQALTSQDTCTATVADVADVSSAPSVPGGSVTFSAAPAGLFALGPRCTLAASASAGTGTSTNAGPPASASCSVVLVPAAGSAHSAVSASYGGDSTHKPATGSTSFLSPSAEAIRYATSGPRRSFPRELTVEVAVPTPGSEVRVSVAKGATGSSRQRPPALEALLGESEEREQEAASPAALETSVHAVEARERAYADQLVALEREAAEARRWPAGLGSASQTRENTIVTGGLAVIAQIEQLRRSPGLQRSAAAGLARLAAERERLRFTIAAIAKRQREETGAAARSGRGKLLVAGFTRARGTSATLKLHVKLRRAVLAALAHGRRSLALELRVVVLMPSGIVKGGVPIGAVRAIRLVKRA